ncbi:MAG: hypothetical protein ACO1NX_09445 [Chitinophagaceae bacterium]
MKRLIFPFLLLFILLNSHAQVTDTTVYQDTIPINRDTIPMHVDTIPAPEIYKDTSLRIINLNPFFTLHVDSSLMYQLQINKNPENYFWYLRNSPVGLRINKDNGILTFSANKSLFLSGRLKYDVNYKVNLGVQNLLNPTEKIDTSFSIVFYNTEIIPSRVRPTMNGTVWVNEGEPLNFNVLCETGSFPIENILTLPNHSIDNYTTVQKCGDAFRWTPPFDFVKEGVDSGKVKIVLLSFVGTTKFNQKDTATLRVIVRDALNYPLAKEEYNQVLRNMERYIVQLKVTFLQLERKLRKTKGARTTFDLTSATTSLTGTILSTSPNNPDGTQSSAQRTGKVLPSIGLAMVPIKEAAVPNRGVDQNQATLLRASIKRLEYIIYDNQLLGERDWDISRKTNKLRDELKQVQMQLIDIPMEISNDYSPEEVDRIFNSKRINKKYRLKS